jgi:hypothetical protein
VKTIVTFKELLKLDDEAKKAIVVCIGLAILVFLHAIDLLVAYWAIKYSSWDAFVLAVIIMACGDMLGIGILLIRTIFKITPADMDKIKIDDSPK